ncbi:MAG: alpha/beta fold hydrolase [Ktedonobacteraceae bacterium]
MEKHYRDEKMQGYRQAFLQTLGTLPEACPLDARVEERQSAEGYTRERISYATSPGVRVPAYLLIPDTLNGRVPAVICIHQHNGEYQMGKSEPAGLMGNSDTFYALELCRRGYITLVPDQEGFEERQATQADKERWSRSTGHSLENEGYEKFLAMRYLLQGSTLQARYVWDLARAVDYLYARPEVDAERIGALGHSLGGQEVCWLLLFDERVRVGVCSCGVGTFETIMRDGINHNFAAYMPGFLSVGDVDLLISTLAPTPLLLTAGVQDRIFPIDGVRQIAQAARSAYEAAIRPDAFRLRAFAAGHSFAAETRAEAYAWLDRWLLQ